MSTVSNLIDEMEKDGNGNSLSEFSVFSQAKVDEPPAPKEEDGFIKKYTDRQSTIESENDYHSK